MARILIVEDSPDNMKLFRTLLTMRGHEVVGLSGGDGLLDTIAREQPALVLMDIQLPGKDGFELLHEIRGSEHRALRVLALTAHAMSGDRERALDRGPPARHGHRRVQGGLGAEGRGGAAASAPDL